jgi:hypothetical protein
VLETIFLDAGGVLVFPNWQRVSDALKARGVDVDPAALAVAEPHVKRQIDVEGVIQATRDRRSARAGLRRTFAFGSGTSIARGTIHRSRTAKSTVATVCSHAIASFPPVRVTSEKKNVSWSSFEAAFESTCIGTRTTSYFGS